MGSRTLTGPLLVIVGVTASGKSALAMSLAQKFGGEIIAADSRTLYKGMNIGTAKPTSEDRKLIPHHGIDIRYPDESFTVVDFKKLADQAIIEINGRNKLPILVGGSGLYIDAVIYDYAFPKNENDIFRREEFNTMSVAELQALLRSMNVPFPKDPNNPRRLIRAIETEGHTPNKRELSPDTLLLGLDIPNEQLYENIQKRVGVMFVNGFVEEVRSLSQQYGWDCPAFLAPGYKAVHLYLDNKLSLDQTKELFVRNDFQLAKRQRTWFKRNKSIHWVENQREAVDLITTQLNK